MRRMGQPNRKSLYEYKKLTHTHEMAMRFFSTKIVSLKVTD